MTPVPEPRVAAPSGGDATQLPDSVGTSCSTGRYLLLHEVLTIQVVRFEMVLASQSGLVKTSRFHYLARVMHCRLKLVL